MIRGRNSPTGSHCVSVWDLPWSMDVAVSGRRFNSPQSLGELDRPQLWSFLLRPREPLLASNCQDTEPRHGSGSETRLHDSLPENVLQGTLEGGRRRRGRPRKGWIDSVKELGGGGASLPMRARLPHNGFSCIKDWKRISVESSLHVPPTPHQPSRSRD